MTDLSQTDFLPGAVVALAFAVVARGLRAVTDGGAIAGAIIAFILIVGGGPWAFVPLMAVFFLTLIATRWRAEDKRTLGIAERRGGRDAGQVLANLGASVLCAAAAFAFPNRSAQLMVGAMAVFAEAAADTVSSETGQAASSQPRMILGFRPAPVGTNGAVSPQGTFAGCIAAAIVAWIAVICGVVASRWAPVIALTAILGMLFDSVMGEIFENRGRMGNDAVNFVSTVLAADLALLIVFLSQRV